MQLSQKQKTFSEFFFAFSKSILNFNICEKSMTVIANVFREIPVPKNMVGEMSKKPPFRGPLDREHGKSFEAMFQSQLHHLYKIHQSLSR